MPARQASCVAIGPEASRRALMIVGAAGTGKSSLALALIDRGAVLIGDDSVILDASDGRLLAYPHPNTRGLIEVRNLGLIAMPVCEAAPVALIVRLDDSAPRYAEGADTTAIAGVSLPIVTLWPGGAVLAIKAELALERLGLSPG
jgi:serine kinase of HPr protein (carbohydrate metabolism regulator)